MHNYRTFKDTSDDDNAMDPEEIRPPTSRPTLPSLHIHTETYLGFVPITTVSAVKSLCSFTCNLYMNYYPLNMMFLDKNVEVTIFCWHEKF